MSLRNCIAGALCRLAAVIDPVHVSVDTDPPLPQPQPVMAPGWTQNEVTLFAHRIVRHALAYQYPKMLAPDRVAATVTIALEQVGMLTVATDQDADR